MSSLLLLIYRVVYALHVRKIPVVPGLINKLVIRIIFGCQMGTGAKIGKGCELAYGGLGICIHERVVIGNNVAIGTGVTIGGTSNKYGVPVIGNNTYIGTGAKILGPVKIGSGCVIGANAVVTKDVPDNSMAVGIPAKVVKTGINVADYKTL